MRYSRRFPAIALLLMLCSGLCRAQLIKKAPPSPVSVEVPITNLVDSVITINEVIVTGFKKTKPYIIEREIPFKRGTTIARNDLAAKLNLCKQQVMNTALFVDVDVQPVVVDRQHLYVVVNVKERWYLFPLPYFQIVSPNFNTWWVQEKHSLNRTNYGIKFMQNNFSGRNDALNFWIIGGYTQQLSLRYTAPYLDNKLKQGFDIGFGYNRNRELNYALNDNKRLFLKQPDQFITRRLFGDFTYSYRPAIRSRHNIRLAYANLTVADTIVKINPQYLGKGVARTSYVDLSYGYSYFNLDYIPYPLKGISLEGNVYQRFGSTSHYTGLNGRTAYIFKTFPKTYLHLQAAGDFRFPFHQPYISNQLMGSTNLYMRGLEYYMIEGVAGGVARATIKNEVLAFNVFNPIKSQTHDKIPFRLFLKAYGDLGYAYASSYGNSLLNNKMLYTWGVGADVVTFYDIVVKFEYSINQLGEKGLFIHTQTDF